MHGGVAEACAGALADLYEELGGPVVWSASLTRPSTGTRCTSPEIRR